jgi:hypothetical protein
MSAAIQTHHRFCFVVDGKEFSQDHPRITGGEIMAAAGIPREAGLIVIRPDGTQEILRADDVINLAELQATFKRCPVFVRG